MGLVAALLSVGACSSSADQQTAPDRCGGAAYVTTTSVPTADVDFYEQDLVLLGPDLDPGRRLTDHGQAYRPRFSPDGERLVFISGRGYEPGTNLVVGLTAIAVIDTAGGEQLDLTADYADSSPAWSPDGGTIAFLRREPSAASKLMLIDPAGDSPRVELGGDIQWFTWLTDQHIVVGLFADDGDDDLEILRLDLVTGELTPFPLGVADIGVGSGPPLWSPDRSEFAFVRYPTGEFDPAQRPVILIRELATGEERQVPGSNTRVNSPLLWTGGDGVMFMKNIAGPDVNIALSADGGRATEQVIGRMVDNTPVGRPQDDNPVCAP